MEEIDFFYSEGINNKNNQPVKKTSRLKKLVLKLLPKKTTIANLPRVLNVKQRYLILGLFLVIIVSAVYIPISAYRKATNLTPDFGGKYTEGLVGEPRYINPLLASTDSDRDLSSIIYSGLMKSDGKGGFVPDLTQSYEISSDGLTYTFFLRKNVLWHDGEAFTAEDVAFTISLAQNSDYSTSQKLTWQGVTVKELNDYAIELTLKNKYAQFISSTTIGILPAHIWRDSKPTNFALSEANLKPIGTGPYMFSSFKKDSLGKIENYELKSNKDYYNSRPYINKIVFRFYNSEDETIKAYNQNAVDGISFISGENLDKIKFKSKLSIEKLNLPRYFAVFFNQNRSKYLADKNIRLALSYGTDKDKIIKDIFNEEAIKADSPVLPSMFNINSDIKKYEYDLDFAQKILKNTGWEDNDNDGILEKTTKNVTEELEIELTTSDWPELIRVANALKEQWAKIGVKLNLQIADITEVQQLIKDRTYQSLLFGEVLGVDPDPFSFWHSSQKKDPGLNLALYDNSSADKILEEARQTLALSERTKKYNDFQNILIEDVPAIFLYSSYYIYPIPKKVQGFDTTLIGVPADRFSNIENWYIDTKRAKKND